MSIGLSVRGLEAGYGGRAILHGVDLDVPAGGALTIVGPNGSGKSTLLKAIVGLIPARAGTIRLGATLLTRLDAPARTRYGLAYVAQEANVFRNMSVRENLQLGWEFGPGHRSRDALSQSLAAVLDLFPELRARLGVPAGLLSGGQRQMVAVASALMLEPSLLVLDEPSAGLSPRNAGLLFEIIGRIRRKGLTLLIIEQNVRLGLAVADQGLVLVLGRVQRVASAATLAADETLAELFLSQGRADATARVA